ncbi:MAG: protein-glutamate O-methyltransferase family protein [Caldilineales bacterium]|nr:protein-glutamate O-methyltransferase family protein [Caldilineales bacterium]
MNGAGETIAQDLYLPYGDVRYQWRSGDLEATASVGHIPTTRICSPSRRTPRPSSAPHPQSRMRFAVSTVIENAGYNAQNRTASWPVSLIMTDFHIPASLLPPGFWPEPILTSEPDSFAHNTLKIRIPNILLDTMRQNKFPPEISGRLEALYTELTTGVVAELAEDTPDREFWRAVSTPFIGRSWLDAPWFWAETYFYRRILQATGYFQPGPWRGFDPFAATKRKEWTADAAPRVVGELLATLPSERESIFWRLLHASLWGNRTDLSLPVAAHLGATGHADAERENLLVDDTAKVWEYLERSGGADIVLIADNAGTELLMDLALLDWLLASGLANHVHLHLKPQPFFVSDAMIKDIADALTALDRGDSPALAARLRHHIDSGALRLVEHWFYTTCLFYFQMPADLVDGLAAADLVIVKGDANYRRLLGDAHWPPTTPFAQALAYFPAPLLSLRTLKAELIVGLEPGRAERLRAEDADWLVNGRRGVIQSRLSR